MNKRRMLFTAVLVGLQAAWLFPVLAAPVPPLHVVHHGNQQCAEIFGGDECMDCFPPEGWEIVDRSKEDWCPEGYTPVQDLDYTCQPFKVSFCCSEGHSGAPGDCKDMVVNHRQDQCAFVDEIEGCRLPERWTARPQDIKARDWVCPADYDWVEDLTCLPPESQSTENPTQRPEGGLPCVGAILIGPAVLGLWTRSKRTG